MHIPDGYLNPPTCIATFAVMVPVWAVAAKKLNTSLNTKQVPFLASGAAFSFVLMMFNFPLPGGSSGHAVGGALLAILLGPWAAVSILSVVIAIQALLFHDGGLTTFGANAFNMAFILPMCSWFIYRSFILTGDTIPRKAMIGGLSGYVGLTVSAFSTAVLLGIQPHGAAGYAPYPLSITIPVMAGSHLLVFSWVEGLVTAFALYWLLQYSDADVPESAHPLSKIWIGIVALMLLSPLGLLANGTAFGEWSGNELKKLFGFIPAGIGKHGNLWHSPLAGYRLSNHSMISGYLVSALLGILATGLFALLIGRIVTMKTDEKPENAEVAHKTEDALPGWLTNIEKFNPSLKKNHSYSPVNLTYFFAQTRELEEFPKRKGFLQHQNPRIKTVLFILLAFVSAWISTPFILFFFISAAFFLSFASKIPSRWFLKIVLGSMAVFTFFIAAPALFSWASPGKPLYAIFPPYLVITREGVLGVTLLVLRATAAMGWTTLLTLTTPWHELIETFKLFRVPRVFLFILEMTFRYIFLFVRLLEQMSFSKNARIFSPLSLRKEQAWSVGRIAFLFKRSMDLSEQVYSAMISRGYH